MVLFFLQGVNDYFMFNTSSGQNQTSSDAKIFNSVSKMTKILNSDLLKVDFQILNLLLAQFTQRKITCYFFALS